MRRAVLGLLAAAGCNQIWGLGPVELAPPGDAPGEGGAVRRVRLTAQITKTMGTGYVDPNLDYGPITPSPTVQLGLIDGPLMSASYDEVDGTVAYPAEFVGKPWRLVYTLADGIPREVHWSPPEGDLVAHIVEPLFGRVPRQPVPVKSGYSITPVSSPGSHTLTRVFTTGIWTLGEYTGTLSGPTLDYKFDEKARSLGGPLAAPERAWSDFAVLADFQNKNGCRVTTGVAAFAVPDMTANLLTPPSPQPQYVTADKQVRLTLAGAPIDARLQGLLGSRAGGSDLRRMEYGITPSVGVFGFSQPPPTPILDFFLPGPLVLAIANCTFDPLLTNPYQSETFADPLEVRDRFPRAVHVEVVNQRVRGTVVMMSGFSAVVTSSDYNFTSDFGVAAPIGMKLVRNGTQIADLENLAEEGTPLPAGTDPIELAFGVEQGALLVADYFDITLYSISTGKLDLQRVYTVAEPRLKIDPTFLQPATEYVFEVRAYRGRPNITRADFATNSYPQYSATIFTRAFLTP